MGELVQGSGREGQQRSDRGADLPASQLGPVPRQIEGIQLGTIEAVLLPADFFVGLEPRYGVFSIPGLFKDMKNAAATIADPALNKEILALGESKGMVGVTAFVYSAADYFGKDPIKRLDDFKGKKFRINATPAERERMSVLGATAVPLPTNEVVPALQRGAIDGTQSAIALFVNFKYIDLGKVLTQTDDTMLVPDGGRQQGMARQASCRPAERSSSKKGASCRARVQAAVVRGSR